MEETKNAPGKEQEIEQVGIRLPQELKEKLEKAANEKGMNFNSFVLSALHQFVENQ